MREKVRELYKSSVFCTSLFACYSLFIEPIAIRHLQVSVEPSIGLFICSLYRIVSYRFTSHHVASLKMPTIVGKEVGETGYGLMGESDPYCRKCLSFPLLIYHLLQA